MPVQVTQYRQCTYNLTPSRVIQHVRRMRRIINGTTFGEKLLNIKCASLSLRTLFGKSSHPGKNSATFCHNVRMSSRNATARYSCHMLTKLNFCRQIFEKYSNVKFHENPSRGIRVAPCGRIDMTQFTTLRRRLKIIK